MSSVKNQVSNAMKLLDGIGMSKKVRKHEIGQKGFSNGTDLIHSVKYYRDVRETGVRWAEFIKEVYGIKRVDQMKSEHTEAFLENLKAKGCSNGHLLNTESHLLKLQEALVRFDKEIRGREGNIRIIEGRSLSSSDKDQPGNRSFKSREAAENVIKNMSKSTQKPAKLGLNIGLRIREAALIRREHVVDRNGTMYIKFTEENAKGVTKGGRPRTVEVPGHFKSELSEMIRGKSNQERLFNVSKDAVQKSFNRACKKVGEEESGFHRLRHSFAREILQEKIKEVSGGRELLERLTANKEAGKRLDSGILRDEKQTYRQVLEKINQVHGILGHGKSRWDLVRVYMSE